MSDEFVPEADALEQEAPVQEALAAGTHSHDIEAPEADAIEQAQPGPLFDEDEARSG